MNKNPAGSNLKAFSLIDTSIILNWQQISPPKIASVGFPSEIVWLEIFCNEECTILNTIHPSGVVFKRVLECQTRNIFSARKWVIIPKIQELWQKFFNAQVDQSFLKLYTKKSCG